MIEASMMINDRMPEYCVERAARILNKVKKPLNGSQVLVLGVAYKQDIDDYRESPAIKVIDHLEERGAEVVFFDPYIKEYKHEGKVKRGADALTKELIESADLVMVTTAHTTVDYDFVQQHAKLVFDTKNAMNEVRDRSNIEVL
jgi:UDP-N-acetyl-D-glucosamine dehydrogenase